MNLDIEKSPKIQIIRNFNNLSKLSTKSAVKIRRIVFSFQFIIFMDQSKVIAYTPN